MRDNFSGKRWNGTRVYPSPVFQAHLSNGEIVRLSYGCPAKATTDEICARARFQIADYIQWTGGPVPAGWPHPREEPYPRDLRIIRLYVEDRRRPGEAFIIANSEDLDPWADYSAASFKRPRTTVKQVKAILTDVLRLVNAESVQARETIEKAEQLLAA